MKSNPRRVILIDDDPFTLAMSKMVVKKLVGNRHTKTFSCARQALGYLPEAADRSKRPLSPSDIILCDLHMPSMDGFQFLDEFEKLAPDLRAKFSVFILSSTSDQKDWARLFEKSCFAGFCSKPLTLQKLHSVIEQASSRH